jgi:hypothetical protein
LFLVFRSFMVHEGKYHFQGLLEFQDACGKGLRAAIPIYQNNDLLSAPLYMGVPLCGRSGNVNSHLFPG